MAEGRGMKERNAYFTVEAALVFPVVISLLLFIIYMLFYQYDRCLLEQDMGAMALWGSLEEADNAGELEEKTRNRMRERYREKYMAWSFTELEAGLEQNRFSAKGAGSLTFPLPGWNIWSGGNIWGVRAEYGYTRLSPVTFIRLCHKFMGGTEEPE